MNLKIYDVRFEKGDASFLIDNGETSILYDTGFGFTGYKIAENIKNILKDRELDYIFLTHSHYDHALGSAYILRKYPNAKVVAGKYAVEIFKRDGAKRVMKELDEKFAKTKGFPPYEFLGDELRVDIPVEDGDIIKTGNMEFRVISLPGHTRCCVGFYMEKEGFFLSNETLGVYDGGETIVPCCLVSFSDTVSSIEKVEKLNISSMLSPHLGLLNEKQTRFFISNMKKAIKDSVMEFKNQIENGLSDEEIINNFKNKYWHGYIKEIYPENAINLNTSIMISLIKKESI